jgi:hypothetical protein
MQCLQFVLRPLWMSLLMMLKRLNGSVGKRISTIVAVVAIPIPLLHPSNKGKGGA